MNDIGKLQNKMEETGILPPVQKMSWSLFVCVWVICAVPAMIFLFLFSSMGIGIETFRESKKIDYLVPWYILAAVTILLLQALLDADQWKEKKQIYFSRALYIFIALLLCTSIFSSAGKYPYGPMCLFALATPLWLMGAKLLCFHVTFGQFVAWLPGPLFSQSLTILVYWVAWTWHSDEYGNGNNWSKWLQNDYAKKVQCPPNFEDHEECERYYNAEQNTWIIPLTGNCEEVYDTCLDSFLLWAAGFFVAVYYFFLSHMCVYVRIDDLDAAPQGFNRLILLLVFGLWCAASLSASNGAVTNAFLAFLLFCGLSVAVIFIFVHSRKSAEKRLLNPFVKSMKEKFTLYGDWFRGGAIFCIPIGVIYGAIARLNQAVRLSGINKWIPPIIDPVERSFWVTRTCHQQWVEVKNWRWTSVLQKSLWIGVIIQTMTVIITKFTYLFLAWLKVWVVEEGFEIYEVTLIIAFVGILLFLFPPIPGVPIYFTSGIVLVAAAQKDFGVPLAIVYTCFFNVLLKLLACTVQQKCIGVPFKNSLRVRQAVGINSKLIRTIKLVLQKPGLSAVKVAILVGGPDWPTSVLCGILDLSLLPLLIGTLPVVLIIVPTVLSGSFIYLSDLHEWAGTASAVSMSVTGLVIMAAPAIMIHHIEKAMDEEGEALESMPYDEEVLKADADNERHRVLYLKTTSWEKLPGVIRVCLIVGNLCMVSATYLVMGFGGLCFREFTMQDNIRDDLDGEGFSLIKLPGWIAIFLVIFATFLLFVFSKWATHETNKAKELERGGGGGEDEEMHIEAVRRDTKKIDAPLPPDARLDTTNIDAPLEVIE